MPDLRTTLNSAAAAPAEPLDLPATLRAGRRLRHRRRLTAVISVVALAVAGMSAAAVVRDSSDDRVRPVTGLENLPVGWTDLPPPPRGLAGGAVAWTGEELVVWSGEDAPAPGDAGNESDEGFAFNPSTSRWRNIAKAPIAARSHAASAWTGKELVVWGEEGTGEVGAQSLIDGAAYDPRRDSWRVIAPAPITGAVRLSAWTGRELLVWGTPQGAEDPDNAGAAYDPARDTWRVLPPAPLRLWPRIAATRSDNDVIVVAPPRGDRSASASAVFNPDSGQWHTIGDTGLNAAGTAVFSIDRGVVAWNSDQATARLVDGKWVRGLDTPLRPMECSPRTVVLGSVAVGVRCDQTVLYDARSRTWKDVSNPKAANEGLWADAVAADGVMLLVGGSNSPTGARVLRAYRPAATPAPTNSPERAPTCRPERLELSATRVRAGDTVRVSSKPAPCTLYAEGKAYQARLLFVGRADPVVLGEVPVARDGSFSVDLEIPLSASPGEAAIKMEGSAYEGACSSASAHVSCALYLVSFEILARE